MPRRADITYRLPLVIGYGRFDAAAAIGVSATTFDAMVAAGAMPQPRITGKGGSGRLTSYLPHLTLCPVKAGNWSATHGTTCHAAAKALKHLPRPARQGAHLPEAAGLRAGTVSRGHWARRNSSRPMPPPWRAEPNKKPPKTAGEAGTFNRLLVEYFASPNFRGTKKSSQEVTRGILERFAAEHGHRRVDEMKKKHVILIMGEKQLTRRPPPITGSRRSVH